MPFAFEWQGGRLVESYPGEVRNSLHEQCTSGEDGFSCPGIASLSPGKENLSEPPSLFYRVGMESLLRKQAKASIADSESLHAGYVDAVLAFDRKTVKERHAQGISAVATAKAITALAQSSLTLPEKRKRIAILFYDHQRLARAFDQEWPPLLLTWLPYEDWAPVLKAISLFGPRGYSQADQLRAAAQEAGMEALACDIDNARGWLCGETVGAGD